MFPDRRLLLVGEIIRPTRTSTRCRRWAIVTLHPTGRRGSFDFTGITPDDVVILPAFGVTVGDFRRASRAGLSSWWMTTCGSVSTSGSGSDSSPARLTAIIHGKYLHEEDPRHRQPGSRGTPTGRYLVLLNMDEAKAGDVTPGASAATPPPLLDAVRPRLLPGFDFDPGTSTVGFAKTTMRLASRSPIEECLPGDRRPDRRRRGGPRSGSGRFDTICSATQERHGRGGSRCRGAPRT